MTDPHTAPQFATAALITIDTQCDVLDDGAFPIAGTTAVLPAMRRLLDAFRAAALPIVHIVRIYEPDGANADICRRGLIAGGARIVIRDSPGAQLASDLLADPQATLDSESLLAGRPQKLGPDEFAIFKPRWGAFYETSLEAHLRARDVSTLIFTGCNFPNCPRTSIYEASERDFRVVVARDALSGLYPRAERELAGIGVVLMTAAEITNALRDAPSRRTHARSRSRREAIR